MQKTLLAAALAVLTATSASAAQVYDKDGTTLAVGGEMEAMYWSNHGTWISSQDQTLSDRARLNMDGRTEITDGISAYGFYEWQVEHADGDSTEAQKVQARFAYLGVDFGTYGKLQFGRYEDPFQNASDVVDNLEETGPFCGLDERNSGHLSYMWEGYGFEAALSYQFAVDKYDAHVVNADIDSGFSVYAGYTTPSVGLGPISIRAGYLYLHTQRENSDGTNYYSPTAEAYVTGIAVGNIKNWDIGLSWGTMGDGLYLATNFNRLTFDLTFTSEAAGLMGWGEDFPESYRKMLYKSWESMVSYGFDSGLILTAAFSWIWQKAEYSFASDYRPFTEKGRCRNLQLIASYDFNENFRVWIEGSFDVGSDDYNGLFYVKEKNGEIDRDAANAVMIGARYTF